MRSLSLLVALLVFTSTLAFKPETFKTCDQSCFCRRGRALSTRAHAAGQSWQSPYYIDPSSILRDPTDAFFTAIVKSTIYPNVKFSLQVRAHEDGVIRVQMDEVAPLRKRYDEAASWALVRDPPLSKSSHVRWLVGKDETRTRYGSQGTMFEVVVQYNPLKVTFYKNGEEQVVLNGRGLLHMEHFRTKQGTQPPQIEGAEGEQVPFQVNNAAWFEGEQQDAWWDETWSTWTDSKPKGPESLSLDITFPNHPHVYGIPEHATNMSLPSTTGPDAAYSDPYRLYNSDVFEYLADSSVALYGAVPLMHAHSKKGTVAVFNAIGSDTWIDVGKKNDGTETHWISESGILDVFILPGPDPASVFSQYAGLTGTPMLPPLYSLAYHQCRWNYVSSGDIRSVQKRFDEEDIPVDVFWLDIEYAEGHKYFMWDEKTFPDPVEMIADVEAKERKMVVIIDPHLKREANYPIYQIASDLGVLVKPKSGEGEYEGWCWPGSSSWIDFFNPKSWDLWVKLFKTKSIDGSWAWTQSSENVAIWNDMNEPSVFNGPEISMPRDNIHYGGWEHRDVHNINGMLFVRASLNSLGLTHRSLVTPSFTLYQANQTYNALYHRSDPPKRPFVLTRAYYAGTQRFAAMWTGDNLGTWEHMAVGMKMVLSNGLAGMVFSGSDVGGFFGNPDPEMLVRWYGVGVFSPFFRAHAHIDTKRREPYLLDEPYKGMIKDMLRLRYAMLPIWYNAFRQSSLTGIPILRPQYVMFPEDEQGFGIDDQFYLGSSGLLCKPVTTRGATSTSVYLSDAQVYYDYFSHTAYRPSTSETSGRTVTVPAALQEIPILIRGGAKGELYLDDGEGFGYQRGELIWRAFQASTMHSRDGKKIREIVIQSNDLAAATPDVVPLYAPTNAFARGMEDVDVRVERVVVVGVDVRPASVSVAFEGEVGARALEWTYEAGGGDRTGVVVVKDPAVGITKDWTVVIGF
ncbi:glycoside hydrolase family 31 protein [Lanmaoa asiatica]|nr:glycoside hydrolase family 31 protein [Lanmaoa asiatica]